MGKLIITHGLPGSGKTTWVNTLKDVVIVERDSIREEFYGKNYHNNQSKDKENKITQIQDTRIIQALRNNKTVVSSDTNLNPFTVARLVKLSKGHELEHKDFDISIEQCLKNNANRQRKVDEKLILKMAKKVYKNGHLLKVRANLNGYGFIFDPNTMGAKALKEYSEVLQNQNGQIENEIIVVDIDGTLAKNNSDFDKYVANSSDGKKHWKEFFENIKYAIPNEKVVEKANLISEQTNAKIVVLTGRSDKYYSQLIEFIEKTGLKVSAVFAKPEGDYRKSKEFKTEKLKELNKTVIAAFDDEKTSLEVFYNIGVPIYRVDEKYTLHSPSDYHIENNQVKKCGRSLYPCLQGKHFGNKKDASDYIDSFTVKEINLFPALFEEKQGDIYLPNDFREKLLEEIEQGRVKPRPSADGELVMLKYSSKTSYEKCWNEITMNCRGLLVDKNYEKVFARGFCKFFNVGEHKHIENLPSLPDNEKVTVLKKMDGSLGLATVINGKLRVFTAGSALNSDITDKAEEILYKTFPNFIPEKNYTYCFEIISNVNPNVVDYNGEERMVALGIIDNKTGKVLDRKVLEEKYPGEKVEIVACDISLNDALQIFIPENEEGYILVFESGIMAKVKGKEYLVIHKLLNSITVKNLGEMIINGEYEKLEAEVKNISSQRALSILNTAYLNLNQIIDNEMLVFRKELDELLMPFNLDSGSVSLEDRELRKTIVDVLKVSPNFNVLINLLSDRKNIIRNSILKTYIQDKGLLSIMSLVSGENEEVGDIADDYL